MTHFEVAIEGLVEWFNTFTEAKEKYDELLELGYYEAVLRFVEANHKPLVWNDRAGAFIC